MHIEIGLPDEQGRLDIFKIHTRSMAHNKLLADDVDLPQLAARTKNFSGAEIEGIVKSAASFALATKVGTIDKNGTIAATLAQAAAAENKGDTKSTAPAAAAAAATTATFQLKQEDFLRALEEVKPAFGAHQDDLAVCTQGGIMDWISDVNAARLQSRMSEMDDPRTELLEIMRQFVRCSASASSASASSSQQQQQPIPSSRMATGGILLSGPAGSGKTTLSADIALTLASSGEYSYVKRVGFDQLSVLSTAQQRAHINKVFEDARRCKTALIVFDDIDMLLAYNPVTRQFAMDMLQTLRGAMKRLPPLSSSASKTATTRVQAAEAATTDCMPVSTCCP